MEPPKIPDWRWRTYRVVFLDKDDEQNEDILSYASFQEDKDATPLQIARSFKVNRLYKYHKGDLDDSEFIENGFDLYKTPPARDVIEKMLLEDCTSGMIQDVIKHKFKKDASIKSINFFQRMFWDTDYLTAYDFAQEYSNYANRSRPDPPPVPNSMRDKFVAFEEGGDVDIDMDKAMKQMFTRAFFRSEKYSEYGMAADDETRKNQKNAIKIYEALHSKKSEENKHGAVDIPDEFNMEVTYPDKTALSPDEVEGEIDMDDPNEQNQQEQDDD